ncbi:MAG: substrate-binding domain-containing protein, partial [Pseudomonadota bacterium]
SDHLDRIDGYNRALDLHSFPHDESLVIRQPAGMEGGRLALAQMLAHDDPPTAVFCTNPLTTVGLLHRCLELGISVPQQLSVIGFDDSDTRYHTFPRYTAVCQDAVQFGYEASRWLTRSLEGIETGSMKLHRPTSLSFNQSTGPAPSQPVRVQHDASPPQIDRIHEPRPATAEPEPFTGV